MPSVPKLTTKILLRSEETGGHVSVTESWSRRTARPPAAHARLPPCAPLPAWAGSRNRPLASGSKRRTAVLVGGRAVPHFRRGTLTRDGRNRRHTVPIRRGAR